MENGKVKKLCKNCKYAVIRQKVDNNAPNVICMKRTNLEKGKVYLTQEDANCRNYFTPILSAEKGGQEYDIN